ncbi:sensor histidine kinase [Streptomyces sp. NPDC051310]|uniref:sensor histidine kinase n=1 Tax=Streptomyces sp. NPDC051310 TaxID=3365649 RepID=UPI00378A6CF2
MREVVVRWSRQALGLALGALTAVAELFLALSLALTGGAPRPLRARAVRLAAVERRRLGRFHRLRLSGAYDEARAVQYVAARWPLGLLGGVVLGCVVTGAGYSTFILYGWAVTDIEHLWAVALTSLAGLLLLFLSVQGVHAVAALEERLARRLLGPSHQDELERRIAHLAASRAEVMDAVHDERRRIERDLHDGVQQRLVALGMLLGRARRSRDPERAADLLLQAHEESRRALAELREVAWRVYPTVLDEAGLRAALESVAERCPLPVGLSYEAEREVPKQVATAAYFVVSEAVTNVVKHAGATRIDIRLEVRPDVRLGCEGKDETVTVTVMDDGGGGADPSGGGLAGLATRVAALDGRFTVDSPAGGPTTVTAVLPASSASHPAPHPTPHPASSPAPHAAVLPCE